MKWSHLPLPGGIYAQDPVLMDRFETIFSAIAKHEEAEAKKREDEANRRANTRGKPRMRSGRI